MSSAAKREARLKAAVALEEASSDKGNSRRTSRRTSAAAAISTTPLLSKPSTSDATVDRMNRRTRLQKSNSKRGGLGGRSGSSRKLAVDDDYSDGEVEPSRESKREARMRAASKLSEAEEAKSTNSGRARRSSLAATLSGDSQSRRSRLEKSGSMRVLQRGNSSRGLGRRGNSSRKLTVDSDEEEEIVEEETFKSKPSSRPRIPRRTTSMEDFQNNAAATTEPNRRRPLQRHKSADGSSMPFKRGQRRPSLALVDRSSSVRRGLGGLGGPGGGGLSRGNSQRRLNNIMNDALEDIDNSNDENPRGPTSRRRRDGASPAKDNSNQGGTSLLRGLRRTLSSDSASIGNSTNTNTSARRARRGSGMIDDSSNRRLGIGRSTSGLGDSSSGRRGVSRNNSGGMIDDSSAVNGKSGGSRRRDGGMRRSGSGGTLDESSNINNSTSRRRGVGRSASGIGGSDAMRRRQTQRFVERVSSIDDDDDEDDFDVAPQDGVLHGRGLGDSTRRRREPTLSRMSINDLRSRLQGTPEEEEAKAAKAKVMGESSQGGDETSEGDIWSTDNVPAPLKSNLNDD